MSKLKEEVPVKLGFRMPAEWEKQKALWLSWPHKKASWPGFFRPIPGKFAEIVAKISRFEEVRINIERKLQERAWKLIGKAGADLARVKFFDHATDDAWCRDHGPIFLKNDKTGEVAVSDWDYNAWGGKYPPFKKDVQIPGKIARKLGMRRFKGGMVLEGGSIDVNGKGTLLTTESCLLNKNRNPKMTRGEIEQRLRDFLGVKEIFWLGDGIVGDDTDGHVDDITRFFAEDGIVTAVERNTRDANWRPLKENLERLESLRTAKGKKFRVVELPMPKAVYCDGARMPASYANFLIINGAVMVPVFGDKKKDAEAVEVLAGCFPKREIVPIDCLELVWGLGALHCISQQEPMEGGK